MSNTSRTIAQIIGGCVFVFVFALCLGLGSSDVPDVLKLTLQVSAMVAPLAFALNRSLALIQWWNRREVVRYRRAMRQLKRLKLRIIRKIEGLSWNVS
jgi:hypothetical protein